MVSLGNAFRWACRTSVIWNHGSWLDRTLNALANTAFWRSSENAGLRTGTVHRITRKMAAARSFGSASSAA